MKKQTLFLAVLLVSSMFLVSCDNSQNVENPEWRGETNITIPAGHTVLSCSWKKNTHTKKDYNNDFNYFIGIDDPNRSATSLWVLYQNDQTGDKFLQEYNHLGVAQSKVVFVK